MKKIFYIALLSFSMLANAGTPEALTNSNQLLLVTTPDWDKAQGTLKRYQRVSPSDPWKQIGKPIPIVVGKNGMGWGVNFIIPNSSGPVKIEGDGKSPAGIFNIGSAFGFSDHAEKNLKLNYLPIQSTTFCVDDQKSKYYNQVITNTAKINTPDWHSGEAMQTISLYKRGAIVEYNMHNPEIGRGSCIFMHIWRTPSTGTAGCIAMEESNINQVLAWLDRAKKPVIATLPQTDYLELQKEWGLPNV